MTQIVTFPENDNKIRNPGEKKMSYASPKYLTTISAYVNHISGVGLNML